MEMFNETTIVELEEKIDGLINSYLAMKDEHEKALVKLQSIEAENEELKDKVNSVKTERELIIGKVTRLLEKVQKVEV